MTTNIIILSVFALYVAYSYLVYRRLGSIYLEVVDEHCDEQLRRAALTQVLKRDFNYDVNEDNLNSFIKEVKAERE